ncbi:hypothetical protein BD410DRAFT_784208 [Rickenella mellea]|uniref:CREG-like beta-barrel domain-containing protein n=1 Tax=Rickenella mellea TaxID=50990 RepID=A0A4Y7QH44_9AGAM|nr:hypothetical protein BD410DRAFT_784208 [Rickenella mellea]
MFFKTLYWLALAWSTSLTSAFETVEDAASIARTLMTSTGVGTMATLYPNDHPYLAGEPFALQEYYSSCHTNGSLTLIFMPISRHSQNILHSRNHSASITVWSSPPAASQARVSLMGKVHVFPDGTGGENSIRECYIKSHPDAKRWLPDNEHGPHTALWARFDPHTIYFVGGFGDEHYIGSIPLPLYQETNPTISVTGRLNVQL